MGDNGATQATQEESEDDRTDEDVEDTLELEGAWGRLDPTKGSTVQALSLTLEEHTVGRKDTWLPQRDSSPERSAFTFGARASDLVVTEG